MIAKEKGRDTTDQSLHKRVGIPRTSAEITTSNEHHTEKKFLGRKLRNTEKYENYHEKLTSHREEVLGPEVAEHRKIRELPWKIMKNRHHTEKKLLGRMLQNTEKHENHHEKSTSHREVREFSRKINIEELKRQKRKKSRSFIVKTTFKSIPEQRKVRELPRKMHTAEVEEAKKCENYHEKPVSDPFNQDHRRTPKSTRITTKNEHRRSWGAGNYENSHTKRTCKHEST